VLWRDEDTPTRDLSDRWKSVVSFTTEQYTECPLQRKTDGYQSPFEHDGAQNANSDPSCQESSSYKIFLYKHTDMLRDSVLGQWLHYLLYNQDPMVRIPAGTKNYSHLQSVQTGSATRGHSQVVKQTGCRSDHPPQLKNQWNYTSTPDNLPFTFILALNGKLNKGKLTQHVVWIMVRLRKAVPPRPTRHSWRVFMFIFVQRLTSKYQVPNASQSLTRWEEILVPLT
jgi:hypothetical protein